LGLFLCLAVQAAPSLTASLDREIVPLGETVTLTLTFQDVSPQGAPNLPPLPNITVASVGNSTEMSIFNGQRTTKYTYTYTLNPTAVGEVTIPQLQVLAGGQLLISQPLKLKVVQTDPNAAAAAAQTAFLKLQIGKTDLYVGEALPVEIILYVQEGRDANMPQLEGQGFTVGKITQGPQTRTQMGNQIFNVVPFRTYVAPARAGQLKLGPASMALTVPKPNARRNIFGVIDPDWQRVNLTAEAQTINVQSLPTENVPEHFNGAVGSYGMQVTAGPTNLAVGDPITVKVQISGRGLLDALALPPQPQWRDFTAYPASSTVESGDPHALSGAKKFEQVLIPQNHEIRLLEPFRFSFFDPQQRQYRTLTGPAFPLSIRATATTAPPMLTNATAGQREPATPDDIFHIKPRAEAIALARPPLIQQPWFLSVQAVPALALISLMVIRRRREALANNPRLRRQREVAHRVQKGLQELHQLAQAQQSEEFFALLFRLLQEQLGERLDLPASSITEAVIDERLRGRGAPPETLDRLHQLFQACNQARYAPDRTTQELVSLIAPAKQMLLELQQIKA
jgi:hypothetical protein